MALHLVTKPGPEGLRKALVRNGGSVTQTATALGVHRVTVHKWMREYGISLGRVPVIAERQETPA